MKTLYLLRHAKSSWDNPGLADQLRPLNNRGKRNAPEMAERFVKRGETIDFIITSPAERARATANAFVKACSLTKQQIAEVPELYFQGLQAFETAIKAHGGAANIIMLVSHNPDLTGFSNNLDQNWHIDNVPTCGLLCFESDITSWADWSPATCRFAYYDYPKNPDTKPITETYFK